MYVRIYAAEALGSMGAKAKDAVEALETLKEDPSCRTKAREALRQINNY